jgi:excisionase family DNA binding protein
MLGGELPSARTSDIRLLTVAQAAEICQLSQRQIRRMIRNGDIPVLRFGRSVRVRPADLGI